MSIRIGRMSFPTTLILGWILAAGTHGLAQGVEPAAYLSLGGAEYRLTSLEGTMAMSRLPAFVAAFEAEADLPDSLLGSSAHIRLELGGNRQLLSGLLTRIREEVKAGDEGSLEYEAEISPWLQLLTLNKNTRLFQEQTVPEIIATVLSRYGVRADYELRLTSSYESKECLVQYNETDLDFVSRLSETAGIAFHFDFTEGTQQLIFTDGRAGRESLGEIPFSEEGISRWARQKRLVPNRWTHTDFNYLTPLTDLTTSASSTIDFPGLPAPFEHATYPGGYRSPAEGEELALIRLQEISRDYLTFHGEARTLPLLPGRYFTLADDPLFEEDYLLRSVRFSLRRKGGRGGPSQILELGVDAIPATTVFRPDRITPKPVIGPQTAFVTGPAGEEIYAESFHRVKVRFPWDRSGRPGENSSCWIRVQQGSGLPFLPEIGDEVLVTFQNGDPDRPLILGKLYNPGDPGP